MSTAVQLAYLHVAHFACHYFLMVFPTAVIAIERDWALDYGEALTLGTPMYICLALGTLPAGWLGDRWDNHHLISLSFLGCGAASVLVALAPNPFWFMAGLALLGLFTAIYHPVGLSLVTRLTDRPGHALAVNGVFGNLGLAGATLFTGLLADGFGWRGAFLVPGIVTIGAGLAHLLTPPACPIPGRKPAHGFGTPQTAASTQMRILCLVLFAALFSGLVFNGVSISLPKLFEERLEEVAGSLSGIGGYGALVFAVAAFAQLPVGALLDRVGGRPVWLVLFILLAVALVATSQLNGWLLVLSALASVTLLFAGIPITGWLMAHHIAVSWRSRAFAAEYVLALGTSSLIVPSMATLHQVGRGLDWQYLGFAGAAAVVALAAIALPKGHGSATPGIMRGWS